MIRRISTAVPPGIPVRHAEVSAVPRSMPTRVMISFTVTTPLPSQSPTHAPGIGVGVGAGGTVFVGVGVGVDGIGVFSGVGQPLVPTRETPIAPSLPVTNGYCEPSGPKAVGDSLING